MKTFLVVAAVIGSLSAIANAQPSGDLERADLERFELSGIAGLGTPAGELGVEGVIVPNRYLEIGLGVGAANLLIKRAGGPEPQIAVMPRLRLPVGRVRLTLGAGLSAGTYTDASGPFSSDDYVARANALWLNGELGAEYMNENGWFAGAFLGFGKIIAHGTIQGPEGGSLQAIPDDALPFIGVKVGYAFR